MTERGAILVPVDFEDPSERALEIATELAGALRCDLWLVHVNTPISPMYPEIGALYATGIQSKALQAAARSLEERAARVVGCRTILREGDPATEILAVIGDLSPRLVVMGTHGRRGVARLLLGSVTERVERESPSPVLTVSARAIPGSAAA